MKKPGWTNSVLIIISILTLFLLPATGHTASLVWSASSGVVDGYKVHWGTDGNYQSNSLDVGATTRYDLNMLPLSEGVTYQLCVSAYNAAGESPPCAPVVFIPGDNTPPAPPGGLSAE